MSWMSRRLGKRAETLALYVCFAQALEPWPRHGRVVLGIQTSPTALIPSLRPSVSRLAPG